MYATAMLSRLTKKQEYKLNKDLNKDLLLRDTATDTNFNILV